MGFHYKLWQQDNRLQYSPHNIDNSCLATWHHRHLHLQPQCAEAYDDHTTTQPGHFKALHSTPRNGWHSRESQSQRIRHSPGSYFGLCHRLRISCHPLQGFNIKHTQDKIVKQYAHKPLFSCVHFSTSVSSKQYRPEHSALQLSSANIHISHSNNVPSCLPFQGRTIFEWHSQSTITDRRASVYPSTPRKHASPSLYAWYEARFTHPSLLMALVIRASFISVPNIFFLFFKFSRAEFVTDGATYTILILNHPQCVVENSWKTLTLADYYFSCTIQRGLLIFSCKSHLPWRFTIVPAALDGHSNGVEVAGTCVIFHNCLNLAPTVYFRLKLHLKLALHIDVLLYVCVEKALNFYFIRLVQHLPIKKD